MIQITLHMRIYLCIAPIDFRKGIDGLSGVCRNILDKDPFSGSMFIFRNKRKTTLKILVYDGQGFWLYVKRLSSGIMSKVGDHVITLYFSGRKYARENFDEVLRRRAMDLGPPLQMCDALNQNYPKDFATILINCLSHGRRKFVELIESYPLECRFVIETLAEVYKYDEEARVGKMTPWERLCFHQEKSKP